MVRVLLGRGLSAAHPSGQLWAMRKTESQEPQKEGPGLEAVKPKLLYNLSLEIF